MAGQQQQQQQHEEEAALLKALTCELTEDEKKFCDSACLQRYLRARKHHVHQAAKLLDSTLLWRRQMKLDTLSISEFEAELRGGKMYVAGNDRWGRSVLVTRKKSDAFVPGQVDHYMRHLAFTLESTVRAMQQGKEKWVWILDMAGYSRANSPPLSVSLATLRVLADHYPERLYKCFFVDAPSIFSWLWAGLSPFIDPVTKAKVVFINSKDLPPADAAAITSQSQAQAAGAGAGSGAADATISVSAGAATGAGAEGKAAVGDEGEDDGSFRHYVGHYRQPYSESDYRALLQGLGWPA